jgi:glycosyltransferase involved in cell wall biosynthesis
MSERQSVILAVRNGATYVAEAIGSALPQLFADDEVVVIDNGSTDDTMAIVRAIGDPRVKLIEESRPGPAAARNAGLKVATGELVSFLDHDDRWPEGRNAGLLAALAADPQADDAHGRLRVLVEPGCDDQGFSARDGALMPSAVMHLHLFRRAIVDATGVMDETMRLGSDADYLARMKQAGMRSTVYDGDAYLYRRHATNITLDVAAKRAGSLGVLIRNLKRRRASDG